jgi:transcriptional regulator with XRE-family HTH domain
MPEPTAFGKRLRAARELRGMSQSELEVKSKVPAMMISHFETGVRANASADTLVKLANALKVSVDYLLGRTDDSVPRGGAVEAVFRKVESASDDTIEHLMTIARALAEQDKKKRA